MAKALVRTSVPTAVPPATDRERRAVAARRQVEDGLLIHALRAHYDQEAARLDASAAFEASKSALEGELNLLHWGLAQAEGSAAAAKLVADRIEQLSWINDHNLSRRFGA